MTIVKRTCDLCGKEFDLGWTGVCPGDTNMCDQCAGIDRSSTGVQQARALLHMLMVILLLGLAVMVILWMSKTGIL